MPNKINDVKQPLIYSHNSSISCIWDTCLYCSSIIMVATSHIYFVGITEYPTSYCIFIITS